MAKILNFQGEKIMLTTEDEDRGKSLEVSNDILDGIISEIELKEKLEKLSNDELVKTAITDYIDWTWHPVIEVMMDRLSPGWAGTDDDNT